MSIVGLNRICYKEIMSKKYEISYTSDIWETVIIEADSKEDAEKLFGEGEHYEQGHDPVEQGKENLKIESVEEVDPDTERPIKKDKLGMPR